MTYLRFQNIMRNKFNIATFDAYIVSNAEFIP